MDSGVGQGQVQTRETQGAVDQADGASGSGLAGSAAKGLHGFGIETAILAMKGGVRVYRRGWNGKNMYLAYQKGYPDGIAINQNTADATGLPVGTVCKFQPYIMMKTADGSFVPWLASQTDLLAEDWVIVEGGPLS